MLALGGGSINISVYGNDETKDSACQPHNGLSKTLDFKIKSPSLRDTGLVIKIRSACEACSLGQASER